MRLRLIACVFGVAIVFSMRTAAQQQPTFRARTEAVTVDVNVRDKSRKTILGLTAADFVILDNGVRQEVDSVSYGKLPVDVTIGLDVSFSVTGDVLERLRRAVVQLMGDLVKGDRLKLVLFNMRVGRSVDFTTDVEVVERAIKSAQAGGGTALYDAISVSLVSASTPNRRQLVVFFTDGGDTSSTTSTDMLVTVAERTQATLSFVMPLRQESYAEANTAPGTIGFTITQMQASTLSVNGVFQQITSATGGSLLTVTPRDDIGSTFKKILEDFRSTYVLYFSPNGVERTGFHTISVQVERPDAVVQARRGYFGG